MPTCRLSSFAFSLCFALSSPVFAGDYTLLQSNTPAYTTGMELDDKSNITLAADDFIHLKDDSNKQTCTMRGPYQGKVRCPFVTKTPKSRATRHIDSERSPTDMWALNVMEDANFCYTMPEMVSLWRPDAGKPTHLQIQTRDANKDVKLNWAATEHHLAWPLAQQNIESAQKYLFTLSGQAIPRAITFHQMPAEFTAFQNKLDWMAEKGCLRQLKLLQSAKL